MHVISSLSAGYAGAAFAGLGLAKALARRGCRVDVVTADMRSAFGALIPTDDAPVTVHQLPCVTWPRLRVFLPRGVGRCLARVARGSDVVHSREVWQVTNNAAARAAHRLGLPHVISPDGALTPYCLRRSAWKKAIGRRLYVDRNLRRAACLHATSSREAEHIRAFGLRQPIAVVPIGVERPSVSPAAGAAVDERWPALRGKKVLLFLSRIEPIKGLIDLAGAWGRAAAQNPHWHLVIAGWDEMDHRREVEAALRAAGVAERTTFTGGVRGEAKWALYDRADLFVLPSHSENFANAVVEALASGVPVITTVATPWGHLPAAGCGWLSELGAEPLAATLGEALAVGDDERRRMGRAARQLAEREYAWPRLADRMLGVYRWLAGKGDRPDCVLPAE